MRERRPLLRRRDLRAACCVVRDLEGDDEEAVTDTVLAVLIATVPGTITAVVSGLTAVLTFQNSRKIEETHKVVSNKLEETKAAVADTKQSVAEIEKHTNSLTEALVKVTGDEAFARGQKEASDRINEGHGSGGAA